MLQLLYKLSETAQYNDGTRTETVLFTVAASALGLGLTETACTVGTKHYPLSISAAAAAAALHLLHQLCLVLLSSAVLEAQTRP
jgi:hypothetical protein